MFDWLFGRKRPRKSAAPKPPPPPFPYPVEIVHGSEALATYERLKREGRGTPVILGDDRNFNSLAELLASQFATESIDDILRNADRNPFPSALRAELQKEREKYADEEPDVESAEWPENIAPQIGPASARTYTSDGPLERVHVTLLPTGDATEAPAYLRFGGWNACPYPQHQVAAARYWRERYGAEIVAIAGDIVEYRVKRRPGTRDEAMILAREHFDFCEDIVLQGTDTLENLAAQLMVSDWWFFWWD